MDGMKFSGEENFGQWLKFLLGTVAIQKQIHFCDEKFIRYIALMTGHKRKVCQFVRLSICYPKKSKRAPDLLFLSSENFILSLLAWGGQTSTMNEMFNNQHSTEKRHVDGLEDEKLKGSQKHSPTEPNLNLSLFC